MQGTQGLQGTTGSQGAQGTTGTQGAQGTQGVQGTTGSQGAQGTQGLQGTTGSQGVQGTQSVQGTQGTQGASGVGGGSSVTVSDTPPTSPTPSSGDVWFESDTTKKYVYYDNYWVETGSPITTIGNLDGGFPDSNYGGMTLIDAGAI